MEKVTAKAVNNRTIVLGIGLYLSAHTYGVVSV